MDLLIPKVCGLTRTERREIIGLGCQTQIDQYDVEGNVINMIRGNPSPFPTPLRFTMTMCYVLVQCSLSISSFTVSLRSV